MQASVVTARRRRDAFPRASSHTYPGMVVTDSPPDGCVSARPLPISSRPRWSRLGGWMRFPRSPLPILSRSVYGSPPDGSGFREPSTISSRPRGTGFAAGWELSAEPSSHNFQARWSRLRRPMRRGYAAPFLGIDIGLDPVRARLLLGPRPNQGQSPGLLRIMWTARRAPSHRRQA